ncbi:M23 family metallopeptidase [Sphingomonas naphthae]|uniref:M23 family metallopeptidase n=1 Tax=Sphingomonas naphthae TaxID=1813468 RepID=A0ABY7TPL2_9SPHN|nr:M23 family metallopeptidase [Sphingomonas naphthae]WCT74320.1 M23 family metallopeptidase [Sphingomonas naphthae]
MNRLGFALILAFLVIGGGFWLLVDKGSAPAPAPIVAPAQTVPAAAAPGVARAGPSGLIVPVAGIAPAQLTDTFGDERGDGTRGHGAIDIMAPRGTPVLAAQAGTVEKLFESENGGHTIYLRSGDGATVTYYAHLDTYATGLAEGQRVTQGQQIGTVGSTGDASPDGPHLHFEVKLMAPGQKWYEGTGVNPYPLLVGK